MSLIDQPLMLMELLCRQRLDGFREQRGEEVYCSAEAFGYAHRSRHRSPISGSVKVRVLTRARGRCECCGARLLLSKPRINGPLRWTTSSPRTRAARTTSATCSGPGVNAANQRRSNRVRLFDLLATSPQAIKTKSILPQHVLCRFVSQRFEYKNHISIIKWSWRAC